MHKRTTILLDPESRRAAKELAAKLDVSPSEVIRRALRAYEPAVLELTPAMRKRRVRALKRLFELFRGTDGEAEIAERKREDAAGW